jgi:hypothetical protein
MREVKNIGFLEFLDLVRGREGIVLLGAGGDPNEWTSGVTEMLMEESIVKDPAAFGELYRLTTSGGRNDVAMLFGESDMIDLGKMAMWRLRFGNCSWVSDYIVNYAEQHVIIY